MERWKIKKHVTASVSAVIGLIAVYGGVVAMNELGQAPEKEPTARGVPMEIQKTPPPPPQKAVERKPEPKRRVSRRDPPPAPIVGLGSPLSGIDFGIPEFQISGLGNAATGLLGSTDDVAMTGESVDIPPQPAQRSPVEYPKKAKKQGVEGYVVLSLLIDETGDVAKARVLESRPSGVFEEAALSGVKAWIFSPAKYKGRPVKVWATQKIRFQMG